MTDHNRTVAGLFAGAGALYLLYIGQTAAGAGILGTMLGFFIGELNGKKAHA